MKGRGRVLRDRRRVGAWEDLGGVLEGPGSDLVGKGRPMTENTSGTGVIVWIVLIRLDGLDRSAGFGLTAYDASPAVPLKPAKP